MSLSNDLISQFVKITKDKEETKSETTVYGTIKVDSGKTYVNLDGSDKDTLTPVSCTSAVKDGDRVTVMIKNHTAIVTGNLEDPSVGTKYVDNTYAQVITDVEMLIADKVSTDELNTEVARIEELIADEVKINEATIEELKATDVEISGELEANKASIEELKTTKLDVDVADARYITAEKLEATDAEITNLKATTSEFATTTTKKLEAVDADIEELNTKKLDAESAKVTYANIDFSNIGKAAMEYFYANSGLIKGVTVGDGTITGKLVGVTISGDLIEGNTVKADKLVVKGSDGLYYKLNIEAGATTSEQVTEADLQNGLHGSAIIAKTITAEKISVDDLVAFDATIGGFNITDKSLYSGAKETVNNTTRGVYLDSDGQMAVGDSNNYIKYYKDTDGSYKLAISANSIILSSSSKNVETAINEVKSSVDNLQIGGRNIFLNSTEWDGFTCPLNSIYYNTYAIPVIPGEKLTVSYDVKSTDKYWGNILLLQFYKTEDTDIDANRISYAWCNHAVKTEYTRYSKTFTIPNEIYYITLGFRSSFGYLNTYSKVKLERGNKPTDWTPAPEDMATEEEVTTAQNTANEANTRVTTAESTIEQLSNSISMLVTDGNGTSLMTQTDEGWTFSTAEIQSAVNRTSESLDSLVNEVGDVNSAVSILQEAVADLGEIAEYVKITTYEDEPCIELGEGDSDFKLRITNTRMMFTEGSTTLAYFNNQSFHVKKAVIEEELQQGGFIWKVRSNGNLGLVWKGVT